MPGGIPVMEFEMQIINIDRTAECDSITVAVQAADGSIASGSIWEYEGDYEIALLTLIARVAADVAGPGKLCVVHNHAA